MKKYLLTGSILSVILSFLLMTESKAQESFKITQEQTSQILKTYGAKSVIIHPVIEKEVSYMNDDYEPSKRMVNLVQDSLIDVNTLTGNFIQLPHKYFVALEDKGKFVKNELIDEIENASNVKRHEKSYNLIQNVDTKELYYVQSDVYLSNLKQEGNNLEVLDLIHRLGYNEYKVDDELYIKSKTSEIKVNAQLLNKLKQNPNYIDRLDSDQMKIATLVKQTPPHTKVLDTYLSIYNIKRSHTPVATINEWRTATAKAQNLFNQIYKMTEVYEDDYSFKLLDKSKMLEVFLDNLNASKGVLGMQ